MTSNVWFGPSWNHSEATLPRTWKLTDRVLRHGLRLVGEVEDRRDVVERRHRRQGLAVGVPHVREQEQEPGGETGDDASGEPLVKATKYRVRCRTHAIPPLD